MLKTTITFVGGALAATLAWYGFGMYAGKRYPDEMHEAFDQAFNKQ